MCLSQNHQLLEENSIQTTAEPGNFTATSSGDLNIEYIEQEHDYALHSCNCYKCPKNIADNENISVDIGIQVDTLDCFGKSFGLFGTIKTDSDLHKFGGICSLNLLNAIEAGVSAIISNDHFSYPLKGVIMMVFVKLKLNVSFRVLALLFNISETTCRRYFHNVLGYIAKVLKTTVLWASKDEILRNMPKCFNSFSSVVVVLDCTEIKIEKPKCLHCRIMTYSHYKGDHTVKFLISVSPAGLIMDISEALGGRASDKHITIHSKILDKLQSYRDGVMVDKVFFIDSDCDMKGIKLFRPAFVKGGNQLSKEDVEMSIKVARARVHVERTIQRFKIFKIFQDRIEWSMLKHINKIKDIIAGLVNLQSSILSEERFKKYFLHV